MSHGRAIVLAYYFPPLTGVASDRAASMCAELPASGWQPAVITPRDGFYHRASADWTGSGEVVRTPTIELSRILRSAYTSVPGVTAGPDTSADASLIQGLDTGRGGSRLRDLVREFVYVPDAQIGWTPFAIRAAAAQLRRGERPAVLWSTSVPFSAHLAAMAVARRHRVPWVAEFRDPWTTAHPDNVPSSGVRRRLDAALERRIVERAERIVVLTEGMREAMLERYPRLEPGSVTVITNGFTPAPTGAPPAPGEPMSLLYAGAVARGEDPVQLLCALDRVHASRPGSFRFDVFGPPGPWARAAPPAAGRPWLRLRGIVSAAEARREMHRASALVLVQHHPAYRIVLPGKFFEYAGARRPILALVPGDWDLARQLRRYADARIVSPQAPEDIVAAMDRLLAEHQHGELQSPRLSEDTVAALRRSEQARKLAGIFDELTIGRG